MSDTLLYSVPAWSSMLFPDHSTADLYPTRRMSDSALSQDSATTATDPDSPATEPDVLHPDTQHPRKPSLPGIGALTPLLDPADPLSFPRRASLPTLTSDLSLRPSPRPSPLSFRPRTYDSQPPLATYAFPAPASPTPPLDSADPSRPFPCEPPFTSPFTSPLSPDYSPPRMDASYASHLSWGTPTSPAPASPPRSTPKRRRSPPSPPTAANTQSQPPVDAQPQRRPRGKLPKHTTDLLKEWLHAHSDHPYPSEDEKRDLCARTKLSMSQVSNWMINARRRILAPAKPPAVSATTTEPYRLAAAAASHPHARPIGSLYPHPHMYAAAPPPLMRRVASEDSLRLYEPAGYPHVHHPHHHQEYPRYAATSHHLYTSGPGIGGGALSAHAHTHTPMGLGLVGAPERRLAYPSATVGVGPVGSLGTVSSMGVGSPYGGAGAAEYTSAQAYSGPLFLPTPGQGQGAHAAEQQPLAQAGEHGSETHTQDGQRDTTPRYFADSAV